MIVLIITLLELSCIIIVRSICITLCLILQSVVCQTQELSEKLSLLVHDVDSLQIELANTNNYFTLLSHKQFIENRTYLEDERTAAPDLPKQMVENVNYFLVIDFVNTYFYLKVRKLRILIMV